MKRYLEKSWVLDCLRIGNSRIHGKGIITDGFISEGTVVIVWGGTLFTENDVQYGRARQHTNVGIGEGLYLGTPVDGALTLDDYMNHSCNPNVWMGNEVTLIARRDIFVGQELTGDYSLWIPNENYRMKTKCNCGNNNCRAVITGNDWMLSTLQIAYEGHFSPFINERILRLKENQK